jgi:hypothetical protein
VPPRRADAPDRIVWHKPVGRGTGDFQPIACGQDADEGITLPWPKKDVLLRLEKPGESWCPDCLTIIRANHGAQ